MWGSLFDNQEKNIRQALQMIDLINKNKNKNNDNNDNIDPKIEYMDHFVLEDELERLTSDEEKIALFDKVVGRIKRHQNEVYENNRLILSLPPHLRLKYMEYYDFNYYDAIPDILNDVEDESIKYKIIKHALTTIQYDYIVLTLFKMTPYDKKKEFLMDIYNRELVLKKNLVCPYNVLDYITQFKIEDRADIIKNVILEYFKTDYDPYLNDEYLPYTRFNPRNFDSFLDAFMDEKDVNLEDSKLFETLKIITDNTKNYKDVLVDNNAVLPNIGTIITPFIEHGYNIEKIIDYLIRADVIDKKIGLCDIVEAVPTEKKKEAFDYLLNIDPSIRKLSEYEFYKSLDYLPFEDVKEYYIKYCVKDNKYNYLYRINGLNSKDGYSGFEYLLILFSSLTPEELKNKFNEIRTAYLEMELFPKYDIKYDYIIKVFCTEFNANYENTIIFVKKFGYEVLKYLHNETLLKYINSNNDNINKLLNLFNDNTIKLNKSVLNDILNSLLQRQFMIEKREVYNIFSTFEHLVQERDINSILSLIKQIASEYDITPILNKYNYSTKNLYDDIIVGKFNILHEITDKYIAHKRELFIKDNLPLARKLLNMQEVISRESYKNDLIKNETINILSMAKELKDVDWTEEQQYLINSDYMLIINLKEYKMNPTTYKLPSDQKKYLRTLNEILDILYDNHVNFFLYSPDNPFKQGLKYDYIQNELSNDDLIEILIESNYEGVINTLSNEENYESLKSFLEKYKMISWKDLFMNLLVKSDLRFDGESLANLISNYDKIKPHIDKKETLTSIIDHINCYSSSSEIYKRVFEDENYNYLAANSGRNKASMPKHIRLEECLKIIPKMYDKEYFSIPTINENVTLSNGKTIQVVIGNATNMINLTYGERTDACMRKGGAFNNLFDHCAIDKNGFHVRFVNPVTNEFVSRVSGTRNGNTVFLNELRNSLDNDYTNEDLYEAIKIIANRLVQLSNNSELPIDNVLITSDYALTDHKDENTLLNLNPEERQNAFRDIPFNFNDQGILLANSKHNNMIVPYVFTDNLPNYESIRDTVKAYYNSQAIKRIIHIKAINDIINGVNIEDINLEYTGDIPDYVISGEDFYIAYTKGNVETYVIDSRKNNPRTIAEINSIINSNPKDFEPPQMKGVTK